MKTFYEEITKLVDTSTEERLKAISEIMDKSEIVNIQNVADYYFEVSDQEIWQVEKDFPNLAPPFPFFWMEYQIPDFVNGDYGKLPVKGAVRRVGVMIAAQEIEEGITTEKWALNIVLFYGRVDGKIIQPMAWVLAIDKLGKVSRLPDGNIAFLGMIDRDIANNLGINEENALEKVDGRYFLFHSIAPALLAMSFMHCKNVEVGIRDPSKISGKRLKRNQPRVRYHILSIEPMKKILREEGQSEITGIKRALHICRGHFKDFSKGKGLFGRYRDLYWWDSQVRGSVKHGVTMKDYDIDAPK